jgi:hypothetical protein
VKSPSSFFVGCCKATIPYGKLKRLVNLKIS